jgi:hypothetical protein
LNRLQASRLGVLVEKVAEEQRVSRTLGTIGSNVNIRTSRKNWRGEHEFCDETSSSFLKIVPWFGAVAESGFREYGKHALFFQTSNANLDVNHVLGGNSRNGSRPDVLDGTVVCNVQTAQFES